MSNIKVVFEFGWKYLRQYWGRLAAAVLLGMFFGLSNASFVWATKTLIDRLSGPEAIAQQRSRAPAVAEPKPFSAAKQHLNEVKQSVDRLVDPFLPMQGRPLDWKQMLGAILFLPLLVSVRSSTDYLSSYCMGWVSERVINDLRLDMLRNLSTLSLDFFTRSTTGPADADQFG